jgi:hypothetical protein
LGWKPETPEERAQVAIALGRWEDTVAQGRAGALALVSALLDEQIVGPSMRAALKDLGVATGNDRKSTVIAASAWLYSQGEAERILDLLLEGTGQPGDRRYLCSQALAGLYRSGQLSDQHKQRIVARRENIVASEHTDVNEKPHYDEQQMLHMDGKKRDPWKPMSAWGHDDHQFPASDCSHTDHLTHRDTRADVELL